MERNHMPAPAEPPSYSQPHVPRHVQLPPIPSVEPLSLDERPTAPTSSMLRESLPRPVEPVERYQPTSWPSSNPFVSYYQQPQPPNGSSSSRSFRRVDSPGAMDLDDSRPHRGGSVVSIDDPDVRLAAEALGDLRADFVQSPPSSTPKHRHRRHPSQQPEPLLSLLTTSHPLVGTAIDSSVAAYSASKNYSPRFKSTAEYVERRFSPVVNKVGSVGRVTGVEGGVRWFLGGRRRGHNHPTTAATDEQSNKRRKTREDRDMNPPSSRNSYASLRSESQVLVHRERRNSQASSVVESLPAYDEFKSPSYEASQSTALVRTEDGDSPASPNSWQHRLILSTSGLSIAMSEESLRSLKYCLGWLRWANEHIGRVINALKMVLEQCDSSTVRQDAGALTDAERQNLQNALVLHQQEEREAMAKRIAELKVDVLKTLKDVVDVVSKYAGGALPENARLLVRRHLTSLPQRFKLANNSTPPQAGEMGNADREAREGARRVMVLAKEGLDMMAQVSGVLDGTIVSAEEWCEKLGKKHRSDELANDMLKEGLPGMEDRRSAFDEPHVAMGFTGGDYKMGQAM